MGILSDMIHASCRQQITALQAQVTDLKKQKTLLENQLALRQVSINTLTSQLAAMRNKYAQFEGKEVIAIQKPHDISEGIPANRAECEQIIRDRLAGKKITWALSAATDPEYRLYPLAVLQQAVASELPRTYASWKPTNTATGWHLEYADCDDDALHWRYWLQRQYPGCPVMIIFIPGHFFAAALAQDKKILQVNGSFENVQALNIWF